LVDSAVVESTIALVRKAMFPVRWMLTALALTVCAVGSLAALATPASAAAPKVTGTTPVVPGSRYLALGDSVTFGYEESAVVPAPNYHNASSFPGYPEQLGAELHLTVANAGCPGETSSSLINASAQSNGCENSVGSSAAAYRKLYPLHERYRGSQLAYALAYLHAHRDVRLVSLMIGANDYFVCVKIMNGCGTSTAQHAVLSKISHNVRQILSTIRNKAHYGGQLVIVNYYSLNYAFAAINAQSIALNRAVDGAAKPFHVAVADGFGELKAAAIHFGGSTCVAGLLTELGTPGKCGVHPSFAGQALLAQALEKAIRL
jgi:lysophospholipase L1-like esterase